MRLISSYASSAAIVSILFALPATGTTIFNNLTSPATNAGFSYGTPAAESFTVSGGNYQLTDVQASVWNQNSTPETVTFSLYSNASGPGTLLATLTATVLADSDAVVISGAPSTSVTLLNGDTYWLALDLATYSWTGGGSSYQPFAEYNTSNSTWVGEEVSNLQFAVDSTPAVPEPATMAMAAIGIGLLAIHRRKTR